MAASTVGLPTAFAQRTSGKGPHGDDDEQSSNTTQAAAPLHKGMIGFMLGHEQFPVPVLVEQFVVVGDKKDAQTPAQLWRFIPKAFKGYHNIPDPKEIQKRAVAEIPLEQILSGWPTGTDPSVHVQAITQLFNSGATIVNIHSGQPDQRKVIDFYGKQVLPRLKGGQVGSAKTGPRRTTARATTRGGTASH
jgi:hypothetical protein